MRKIPDRVDEDSKINKFRKLLVPEGKNGSYYRGESLQLTTFQLLKCPECETFYEDAHYYYSDPESTMGLGRDEDDWYVLKRLTKKEADVLISRAL
jgi:uncharacterized C2H2 Zn-finger protein